MPENFQNFNQLKDSEGKTVKAEEFRAETNRKIEELLKNNTDLSRVAVLLGAEKYLKIIDQKKSLPVYHFDVKAFIDDQIKNQTYIILPNKFSKLDDVILPPDPGEIETGSGEGMESKEIIPRSQFLIELLSEMKLNYDVIEGENLPNMMRKLSYYAFIIKEIEKLVLVNNEEGNATFVIYEFKGEIEEAKKYLEMTKDELKDLSPEIISHFNYSGDKDRWKVIIKDALKNGPFFKKKILKKENGLYEKSPEGWVTNGALSGKLKKSQPTIKRVAEKYRKTNPEWFKVYLDKIGRPRDYYSPKLAEKIKEELSKHEKAPEGWITNRGLSVELTKSKLTIKKTAEKYRKTNPEWFKVYLDKVNRPAEHYSPELVEKIKKELSKYEKVPEGWITRGEINKQLNKSFGIVGKTAEKYRKTNPEWFKVYLDKAGRATEHYSPKLAEKIKEELSKHEKAPEGWVTNSELSDNFKKSFLAIKRTAKKYRKTNPEWFKVYLDKINHSAEHYSPELVEKIKKELSKYEKAPSNWLTNLSLSIRLSKDFYTVKRIAEKYRKSHSEWFEIYLDKNNQPREHYSPELIEKIGEELSKYEKIPEGWITNKVLSVDLNRGELIIKKTAEKYRKANPEWFDVYLDKARVAREHYSPELIAIIKEQLEK